MPWATEWVHPQPYTRNEFDEAVKATWTAIAELDAMPASTSMQDAVTHINGASKSLLNAALDRRADFVWDDECLKAFADVNAALRAARTRWEGRHCLHWATRNTMKVHIELLELQGAATKLYRKE